MKQDELFRLHPERQHPKPGAGLRGGLGPGPPKKLKLSSAPKEAAILASVLQALNFYPSVVFAHRFNSGAYAVGEGKARRFVRFGFQGCPDILGMLKGGSLLAIECKSPAGKLTDHQERFLDMVNAAGGLGFVCRSVSDLKQHLGQS